MPIGMSDVKKEKEVIVFNANGFAMCCPTSRMNMTHDIEPCDTRMDI